MAPGYRGPYMAHFEFVARTERAGVYKADKYGKCLRFGIEKWLLFWFFDWMWRNCARLLEVSVGYCMQKSWLASNLFWSSSKKQNKRWHRFVIKKWFLIYNFRLTAVEWCFEVTEVVCSFSGSLNFINGDDFFWNYSWTYAPADLGFSQGTCNYCGESRFF